MMIKFDHHLGLYNLYHPISSISDVCNKDAKDKQRLTMISTALYGASAASRLLMNCITSPIQEEPTPEEGQVLELPMLEGGKSEVGASGATNDKDGKDSILPVLVCCGSSRRVF